MHITARNPPYCTPAPSVVSLRSDNRCGVQPVTRVRASRRAAQPVRFIRLQTEPAHLKTQTTTFTVQYSLLYLQFKASRLKHPSYPSAMWDKHCAYLGAYAPALGTIFLNCTVLYPLSRNLRFSALALMSIHKSALAFTS